MPRPLRPSVRAITEGDSAALRWHILAAAYRVIERNGLAGASTRAIAEEAGLAAGTLYNYFGNHIQLLAKSIVHNAKSLTDPVADFPSRAGQGTVAGNLQYFTRQAAVVLGQLVPTFAAAFSNGELLAALRREIADAEPLSDPAQVIEQYLLAERDLGRVSADADCRAAASLIVSICHADAFQRYLEGSSGNPESREKEIALITRSLTTGTNPDPQART
jgi:AcrR family transcriptional regulator